MNKKHAFTFLSLWFLVSFAHIKAQSFDNIYQENWQKNLQGLSIQELKTAIIQTEFFGESKVQNLYFRRVGKYQNKILIQISKKKFKIDNNTYWAFIREIENKIQENTLISQQSKI